MARFISRIDPEVERVWRENRNVSTASIVIYRHWIRRFVEYCQARKLEPHSQLTRDRAHRFARWYARGHGLDVGRTSQIARSVLGTWALALRILGRTLPQWAPVPQTSAAHSPLLSEFAQHLRDHHGNPPKTIHKKTHHIESFISFLRRRRRHPQQARLRDIDAFLIHCRKRYARITAADIACSVRGFMRFQLASGRIKVDLAAQIAAPIVRQAERPHRTLPWADVRRILRAAARAKPPRRRDYALLLMMSTYGMGAAEVRRLTLDDIDWQAATIHVVRSKTGVQFLLPLLPAVARALVQYLRHERPLHALTRHVFVARRAPHNAFSSASAVQRILHTHAQHAGVSAPFLGTHVLRHTHACRQMELGTAPKLIGDILGHRDPQSISAYLRVSTERLRKVALPVPQ